MLQSPTRRATSIARTPLDTSSEKITGADGTGKATLGKNSLGAAG